MKHLRRSSAAIALAAAFTVAGSWVAEAETPADQLVVGFSMLNVLTLDPHAITGRETVQILANVYDNLVELDAVERSQVNPELAESWEVSEDGRTITFHLREDATFASGNPVRAEDVVWSLRRLMELNLAQASFLATHGFTAENAEESFVAVDEHTVEVHLPNPVDPQLIVMTLGIVGPGSIIDKEYVLENAEDEMAADWLAQNSAGSAPYTLQSWRSNELVLLSENENYWGEPPAMQRIIMRHIPESQTQRLQLERGDIDIAYSLSAADLAALEDNPDIEIQVVPSSGFYYLGVSMEDERFQNPKVREALRYLIDYEGMNEAILPYYGEFHQRPLHTGFLGTLENPGYEFDPERAQQLLAEAGYPDGFSATLRALSEDPFHSLATALQNTLAQGGIDVELITGSGDQIYGAMRERNFEMIVGRGGGGQLPHPDSNLRALVYNPDNTDEAALTNFQGWRTSFQDEELNRMIDEAATEGDPEVQRQMYEDIQRRIEELVHPIQQFSEVVMAVAYREDVEGLVLHPSWSTDLSDVTKDR